VPPERLVKEATAMAGDGRDRPIRVFNVLRGEGEERRTTPYGAVGTLFSGSGIELVWVSKQDEQIDDSWFSSDEIDLLLVLQGQLKFEFEAAEREDLVLAAGDVIVLPAGERCRAYRWPRSAREATVFVAAYPVSQTSSVEKRAE
jgi:uncharacterized protein YjlB